MILKSNFLRTAIGSVALLSLVGCGSGQDPLNLIDPTLDPIEVSLPFSGSGTLTSGFSSSSGKFIWTMSVFGSQTQVSAPAAGVVTDINLIDNSYEVSIRVNSRYSVKVGAMTSTANVREGDTLTSGTLIGNTTSLVSLTLYEDNVETCPLAHLSSAALTGFNYGVFTAASICQ